mmetsp:Transcript_36603/g.74586  ORF Transcript_36603/g.74586 Transcript_36603/m.74586 type:complete len:243 (+) Transcript_36603:295-1023(+)
MNLERREGIGIRRVDTDRLSPAAAAATITATPVASTTTTSPVISSRPLPPVSFASTTWLRDAKSDINGLLLPALAGLLAWLFASTQDEEVLLLSHFSRLASELVFNFPPTQWLECLVVRTPLCLHVLLIGHGIVGRLFFSLFNLLGSLILSLLGLGSVDSLLALYNGAFGAPGIVLVRSPVAGTTAALLGLLPAASTGATIVGALAVASGLARSAPTLGVAIVVGVAAAEKSIERQNVIFLI